MFIPFYIIILTQDNCDIKLSLSIMPESKYSGNSEFWHGVPYCIELFLKVNHNLASKNMQEKYIK